MLLVEGSTRHATIDATAHIVAYYINSNYKIRCDKMRKQTTVEKATKQRQHRKASQNEYIR